VRELIIYVPKNLHLKLGDFYERGVELVDHLYMEN
jgi:hypothetical protein